VAIIVDKLDHSITQLNTVSTDTDLAEAVKAAMNSLNALEGYAVQSAQQIVQTEGHSCAINVVDIFLQDDDGEFKGKILYRKSFRSYIYEHFGIEPVS